LDTVIDDLLFCHEHLSSAVGGLVVHAVTSPRCEATVALKVKVCGSKPKAGDERGVIEVALPLNATPEAARRALHRAGAGVPWREQKLLLGGRVFDGAVGLLGDLPGLRPGALLRVVRLPPTPQAQARREAKAAFKGLRAGFFNRRRAQRVGAAEEKAAALLPPAPAVPPAATRPGHCGQCDRRISVALSLSSTCRCGVAYCGLHRHCHGCSFDHRAAHRAKLKKELGEGPPVSRKHVGL